MRHLASSKFWTAYMGLPAAIRDLADKNFALLKADPHHPSLHLKKVGGLFSARIGLGYRAIAVPVEDGLL